MQVMPLKLIPLVAVSTFYGGVAEGQYAGDACEADGDATSLLQKVMGVKTMQTENKASGAPLFSKESCREMFAIKLETGGVPPDNFVTGCTEVCDKAKSMKEYWESGDMAEFACKSAKDYGCVYDGTPPVTLTDIGC